MTNDILVNLPGFWQEYKLSLALIDLHKKYNYVFKPGIIFNTVYDSFPCIWTGGRSAPKDIVHTKEMIAEKIVPFLERGVGIRYNFTNLLLREEHLYNQECNNIMDYTMEILKDYPDLPLGITISSDILREYLDKKYPNLYFIWSTTLGKIGIDEVNRRSTNDMLVLDFNYNNDFDFLKQLNHPENIEILTNEGCIPHCPYRDLHWKFISELQLITGEDAINVNSPTGCLNKIMKTKYGSHDKSKTVTFEEMQEKYYPLGIDKMKLAGRREEEISLLGQYIEIFIKPEYRGSVMEYIAKTYIETKYDKYLK